MLHSNIFVVLSSVLYLAVLYVGIAKKLSLWQQVCIFALYFSGVILLSQELFPILLHGNDFAYNSLVPFSEIRNIISYLGYKELTKWVVLSVLLYLPFGFFTPYVTNKVNRAVHALLLGILIFAGIELIGNGIIPVIIGARYRNFILDKVLISVLGVVLGFVFHRVMNPLVSRLILKTGQETINESAVSSIHEISNYGLPIVDSPKTGTILQAQHLTKVFGKGDSAVTAINDVSVSFSQGDFAAIIGASGSGKSTLLHILSTLDSPTSGQVLYQGKDIFTLTTAQRASLRRRNFGFVFQFFNLVPILTVAENITLPIIMDGEKPDQAHINKLIDMLGIRDKYNTLPSKLSGGQQQRVAIARALAAKPAIVFADEPTGNLDSKNSKTILHLFQETAQSFNQTMVIVTHDPAVASICQRVIELEDGVIISDARGPLPW